MIIRSNKVLDEINRVQKDMIINLKRNVTKREALELICVEHVRT